MKYNNVTQLTEKQCCVGTCMEIKVGQRTADIFPPSLHVLSDALISGRLIFYKVYKMNAQGC